MFGATAQTAVLKRFRLVNSYFESDQLGIGSIVGQAVGTFDTIYSSAIVVGDKSNIGGFIGRATDKPENTITITNCWFDGTVINKGTDTRRTGGFIGHVVDKITIEHCLNTGTVDVRAYTAPNSAKDGGSKHVQPYAGGIFGWISPGYEATIKDCLCAGKILMSDTVTSAAGSVLGYATGTTTISDTYATKESSAYVVRGTIKGEPTVYAAAQITGYDGYRWTTLDFGGYWAVSSSGTPVLKSFAAEKPSLAGVERMIDFSWYDASKSEYTLADAADLFGFAMMSQTNTFAGKTVKLGTDMDLNPGWEAAGETVPNVIWSIPIGSTSTRFNGVFDGRGHTISGMYLNATASYQGMFSGTGANAVVKDFKLKNSYFTSTGDCLGSIVGNAMGRFEKIYSAAIVKGYGNQVGGLIGATSSSGGVTMKDCCFDGLATIQNKKSYLGGLIGVITGSSTVSTISNCLHTGEVYHYGRPGIADVGGFVGLVQSGAVISDSVNHTNPAYTGGSGNGMFVGEASNLATLTLTNCHTINWAGKNLVGGVTDNEGTYPTCTRQKKADVAGEKSLTAVKVSDLFTSDSAKDHWVCSADSLPVLAAFKDEYDTEIPVAADTISISTAEELLQFAADSQTDSFAGKTVQLTADIDLNPGFTADAAGMTDGADGTPALWTPIGNTTTRFNGTFDGQGHTISGMYLNASASYQGMFGGTGTDAVVKDFKLKNSYFTSTGNQLGSIVGNAMGTFEKIYSDAVVYGKSNYVGGLIGATSGSGTVAMTDCAFAGSVTMNAERSYLGGLIGLVQNSGTTIGNCLNTGEIYHKRGVGTSGTGCFVGRVSSSVVITDSVNHSNAQYTSNGSTQYYGLFVGHKAGSVTLTNCHTINYPFKDLVYGDANEIYDTCTRQNKADVAGEKSLTAAKVSDLFTADSAKDHWVCSADSLPILAVFEEEYTAEEPTDPNTIYIATKEAFLQFAADSQTDSFAGKTVKLTADIDLNPGFTASTSGMTDGADGTPAQWTPIGNTTTRFNGTFDGQGHTISGMYLNASASYQGMFGGTDSGAVIRDFKLKNSYFTTTNEHLGSIVGSAAGTFEKIYSDAIVYGQNNYVGGLIGSNGYGKAVTMTDCAFAGSATMNVGSKGRLGGLIGLVQSGGATIDNCLNTGEVAHKATHTSDNVGGFVGQANVAISISNSVNHTNPTYTSGSAGRNGLFVGYASNTGSITLTNCHSVNYGGKHLVSGVTDDAGAYPTCSRQNKADVAGEKSLTAAKVSDLFTADSAKDHWVCSADSLPILAVFEEEYTAEEPVDPNTIYIATKEAFLQFAADSQTDSFAGKTVKLTADIDLNPGFTASTSGMTDGADGTPAQWTPIGNTTTRFNGIFDGQGHTISGMYLNASASYQGMFGGTGANAVVKDFKLKNSYFTTTGNQLGSIVGNALGTFDKIYSEAIVKGRGNQVGGLIGATSSAGSVTLTNCWFSGSATMNAAKSYLGGLIGVVSSSSTGSTISNCLNTGTVHHNVSVGTADVGGFIGWAQSTTVTISNSVNHSNPTYTAGSGYGLFVGHASNTGLITLTNCHSVNYGGKHLVSGVTDDAGAYPTCSRQNKADVAGLKALTVEKVKTLFTSDSAKGYWVCSADSLPVLSYFADEYSAGVVEES